MSKTKNVRSFQAIPAVDGEQGAEHERLALFGTGTYLFRINETENVRSFQAIPAVDGEQGAEHERLAVLHPDPAGPASGRYSHRLRACPLR